MTSLQLTDFELAVLIGIVLVAVVALVLIARRFQPAPTPAAPTSAQTSSAVPADLAAIEAEIASFKGRLKDVEHDVKQVRTMLNALPTKDSVHDIALEVRELKGDLKLNNAQTATTATTVDKIMNWLMDEAKTKAAAR